MTPGLIPDPLISIERGAKGIAAFAIQSALNKAGIKPKLVLDFDFGEKTEDNVRRFQSRENLITDGIFGPGTSLAMANFIQEKVERKVILPWRLLKGQIERESGNLILAQNRSVAGGIDCGYTQRRVYERDYNNWEVVSRAFDSFYQIKLSANQLRERHDSFLTKVGVTNPTALKYIKSRHERAWRLALLNHNWPYGATRLADGYYLSDRTASWAGGSKFKDGTPVITYMDWAKFYALGAPEHNHPGLVAEYVVDWKIS